jgi:hypothetical protein
VLNSANAFYHLVKNIKYLPFLCYLKAVRTPKNYTVTCCFVRKCKLAITLMENDTLKVLENKVLRIFHDEQFHNSNF